jgi:hypothetical protein
VKQSVAVSNGPDGLDPHRLAEVIVVDADGRSRRGSGYRVTTTTVLTAAHVTRGAATVLVRFDAAQPTEWTAAATVAWSDADSDLAVLAIEPPEGAGVVTPARYGRLGDHRAFVSATAAGFPWWKQRSRPGGGAYRDLHDATGTIAVLSNRRSGTLEFTTAPPQHRPAADGSAWEGMSGAALWVGGRIVGVVTEQHALEGGQRLSAARLDPVPRPLLGLPDRAGLPDIVRPAPSRLARAGYLEQVRDIAPVGGLKGREAELDELAAFCAGDEPYGWWRAGPWTGKTALLATFTLHPPDGVDVLSFFVTGRLAAQSDSEAFSESLLAQLYALLGEDCPPALAPSQRDSHRRELLRLAAAQCAADGRRLALVVDGLDEDTSTSANSRQASIAALLPKSPGANLRVILAGRELPDIPEDVPRDHPIRSCRCRTLEQSPYARKAESEATLELRNRLQGSPPQRDVLGFLAAGGGGLTQADLGTLTGHPPFEVDGMIRGSFGRTVMHRDRGPAGQVYLFAHDTLREIVERQLGDELLAGYRRRIHAWADGYQAAGWPAHTPGYLLDGYRRVLTAEQDAARLAVYALDRERQRRILATSGANAGSLAEIRAAQDLLTADGADEPDLLLLVRLAIERDRLGARSAGLPVDLPAVWVALGQPERAEALAVSIPEPGRRRQALTGVVEATADAGDYDRAVGVAASIEPVSLRGFALTSVVHAAIAAGRLDRAADIAGAVEDPQRRLWALVSVIEAGGGTTSVLDLAERAAGAVADPAERRTALTAIGAAGGAERDHVLRHLAVDRARAGHPAEAATLAGTIADSESRSWAYAAIAHTAVLDAAPDRARQLLPQIGNRSLHDGVVSLLVRACLAAGDVAGATRTAGELQGPSRPVVLAELRVLAALTAGEHARAVEAAAAIPDGTRQAHALQSIATTLLDRDERHSALAVARRIGEEPARAAVLARYTRAALAAGDARAAAAAAGSIRARSHRDAALAAVARWLETAGDVATTAAALAAITDPVSADWARIVQANSAVAAGDFDTATAATIQIRRPDLRLPVVLSLTRELVARRRFRRAADVAGVVSTPERDQVVGIVMRAVRRAGEDPAAFADGLLPGTVKAAACAWLAEACCDAGRSRDALAAAVRLVGTRHAAVAHRAVTEFVLDGGDPVDAMRFLLLLAPAERVLLAERLVTACTVAGLLSTAGLLYQAIRGNFERTAEELATPAHPVTRPATPAGPPDVAAPAAAPPAGDPDGLLRRAATVRAATALGRHHEAIPAGRLLAASLRAADDGPGPHVAVAAAVLEEFVLDLVAQGRGGHALEIVTELPDHRRNPALQRCAMAAAAAGDTATVVRVMERLTRLTDPGSGPLRAAADQPALYVVFPEESSASGVRRVAAPDPLLRLVRQLLTGGHLEVVLTSLSGLPWPVRGQVWSMTARAMIAERRWDAVPAAFVAAVPDETAAGLLAETVCAAVADGRPDAAIRIAGLIVRDDLRAAVSTTAAGAAAGVDDDAAGRLLGMAGAVQAGAGGRWWQPSLVALTAAAVGARRFEAAQQLLPAIADPVTRHDLFVEVAAGLIADGEHESAFRALASFDNGLRRAELVLRLARACATTGRLDRALQLITNLGSPEVREAATVSLIVDAAEAGDFAAATAAVAGVRTGVLRKQAWQGLARAACAQGQLERAAQYAGPDRETFIQLAGICGLRGDVAGARWFAARVTGAAGHDEALLNAVQSLTRVRQLEPAASLAVTIATPGPRHKALVLAAQAFARAGQDRGLVERLPAAQQAVQFDALARIAVAAGHFDAALAFANRIADAAGRCPAVSHVAVAVDTAGDPRRARQIADQLDEHDRILFEVRFAARHLDDDIAAARAVAGPLGALPVLPSGPGAPAGYAAAVIAGALLVSGDLAAAKATITAQRHPADLATTLMALAQAAAVRDHHDVLCSLALRLAQAADLFVPVLSSTVLAATRSGHTNLPFAAGGVSTVAVELRHQGLQAWALGSLAELQAMAGFRDAAMRLVSQIRHVAERKEWHRRVDATANPAVPAPAPPAGVTLAEAVRATAATEPAAARRRVAQVLASDDWLPALAVLDPVSPQTLDRVIALVLADIASGEPQ